MDDLAKARKLFTQMTTHLDDWNKAKEEAAQRLNAGSYDAAFTFHFLDGRAHEAMVVRNLIRSIWGEDVECPASG